MLKSEGGLENPPKLLMLCKKLISMDFLSPPQNICMVTHTHTHTHTHTILVKVSVGFLCTYDFDLKYLSNFRIY